jgi:hypothetical protein
MTRLSLAYLAGLVTAAGAVYLAGQHLAAAMFMLGVFAALGAALGALSGRSRILRAARFLNAFGSALGASKQPVVMPATLNPRLVELETDLVSALVNLGFNPRSAAELAHESVTNKPNATFGELIAASTRQTRKRAC